MKRRNPKLTADIVRAMRIERRRGMSMSAIARMANVSSSCAVRAIRGDTWGHVLDVPPVEDGEVRPVTAAKLDDAQVREVKRQWITGRPVREIADEFGVSVSTIRSIYLSKSYRWVK